MSPKSKLPTAVLEMLETSSINLVKLDDRDLPTKGHGSGVLINYDKYIYLLTVTHNIGDGTRELQIPMKWTTKIDDSVQPIGRYLKSAMAGKAYEGMQDPMEVMENIDFSYCRYPYDEVPVFNKINKDTEKVQYSKRCTVFEKTAVEGPSTDAIYGFAGHTKPNVMRDDFSTEESFIRLTEFLVAYDLKYVGEEKTKYGMQYAFELPEGHSTEEATFKGCSGAPILDGDGKIVALVSCGLLPKSRIYGVPINQLMAIPLCDSMGLLPQ